MFESFKTEILLLFSLTKATNIVIRYKKTASLRSGKCHLHHMIIRIAISSIMNLFSKFIYPAAGHKITGNLKIILDLRIHYKVSKGPKYRFPSRIDYKQCRKEIASALNDFGNRWCKREYVEPDALKEWKISIFKIVDQRIKFYSQNTNFLPPKPQSTFRHLKQGMQDFHRKYVLVPADKAANNVVVV